MTAAQIAQIQQQNAAARAAALKLKRTPPQIGDVWRKGLVTETHALRFAELEQAAGRPLAGDFDNLIKQVSQGGAEGVMLSVNQGAAGES